MAEDSIDETEASSNWSNRFEESAVNLSRPLSHRTTVSDMSSVLSDSFVGSSYGMSPTTVLRGGPNAGRNPKASAPPSFSRFGMETNDWLTISRSGSGLAAKLALIIHQAQAAGLDPLPGPIYSSLEDFEKRKLLRNFESMQSDSAGHDAGLWQQSWTHFFWQLSRDLPSSQTMVRDSFISTGFGSVMSTVEILSEASSRVPGGVDAESLEELIWHPFIAFHQRTHLPATWDSFIRQFIKLVRRHGSTLFGKQSNGKLLKETCQWLIHVAVFDNHDSLKDKALVALLILIADSVREQGTVAAMTINLTVVIHELLKNPSPPIFGKSALSDTPSSGNVDVTTGIVSSMESSRPIGRTFPLKHKKILADLFGGPVITRSFSSNDSTSASSSRSQEMQGFKHRRSQSTEKFVSFTNRQFIPESSSATTHLPSVTSDVSGDKWDQSSRNKLKNLFKILCSFTASKVKFENNDLTVSVLEEIAGRWRWEEVKALSAIIHHFISTFQDHSSMKSNPAVDPYVLEESFLECSRACEHVPDLRIHWLLQLSQSHKDSPNPAYAESAQCLVSSAAIIIQYLIAIEEESKLAWNKDHFEILRSMCPDVPLVGLGFLRAANAQGTSKESMAKEREREDTAGGKDASATAEEIKYNYKRRLPGETRAGHRSATVNQSMIKSVLGKVVGYMDVTEDSVVNYLQSASELFFSAQLYEFATKVLQLLVVVHKKRGNHKGMIRCHKDLAQLFWKMAEQQDVGFEYAESASYYWLKFHGDGFGHELNKKEFVYKETGGVRLTNLMDRWGKIYERKVGSNRTLRIITDPMFFETETLNSETCYLQVTPVQPIPTQSSEVTPLKTGILGPFKQFYYKLPVNHPKAKPPSSTYDALTPEHWKHRAVITAVGSFPSFFTRWKVEGLKTRVVSPLELSVNEVDHWCKLLCREMEAFPEKADLSQLTNTMFLPLKKSLEALTSPVVLRSLSQLIHANHPDLLLESEGLISQGSLEREGSITSVKSLNLARQGSGTSENEFHNRDTRTVMAFLHESGEKGEQEVLKLQRTLSTLVISENALDEGMNLNNGDRLSEVLQEYMEVCLDVLRKMQTRSLNQEASAAYLDLASRYRLLSQELSCHIPSVTSSEV